MQAQVNIKLDTESWGWADSSTVEYLLSMNKAVIIKLDTEGWGWVDSSMVEYFA